MSTECIFANFRHLIVATDYSFLILVFSFLIVPHLKNG